MRAFRQWQGRQWQAGDKEHAWWIRCLGGGVLSYPTAPLCLQCVPGASTEDVNWLLNRSQCSMHATYVCIMQCIPYLR